MHFRTSNDTKKKFSPIIEKNRTCATGSASPDSTANDDDNTKIEIFGITVNSKLENLVIFIFPIILLFAFVIQFVVNNVMNILDLFFNIVRLIIKPFKSLWLYIW